MVTATLRTDSSPLSPAIRRLRELRSSGDLPGPTGDDLAKGVDDFTERVREASEHMLETLPDRLDAVMADAGETLRVAGDSLREAGDSLRASVHELSAPRRRGPSATRIVAAIALASAAIGVGAWLARRRGDAWRLTPVGPGRLDRATSTDPFADPLTSARLDREAADRAADEGMTSRPTLTDMERRDVLSPDPLTADASSGDPSGVRSANAGAWTER